jgi:hypothetical protein
VALEAMVVIVAMDVIKGMTYVGPCQNDGLEFLEFTKTGLLAWVDFRGVNIPI